MSAPGDLGHVLSLSESASPVWESGGRDSRTRLQVVVHATCDCDDKTLGTRPGVETVLSTPE